MLHFKGIENLAITLIGTIEFPKINDIKYYSNLRNDRIAYPDPEANTFLIKDFAKIANANLSLSEIQGGIIEVRMDWDCTSEQSECKPDLKITFVNQSNSINPLRTPLVFYAEKSIDNEDSRDYFLYVALKFKLISSGKITVFNFYKLIIQVII